MLNEIVSTGGMREQSFFDGGLLMEKKRKKLGKKWIWIAAVLAVLLAAGGFLYLRVQALAANGSTNYTTQPLSKGSISSTVGATGNVYTRQSVQLTWKTGGIVDQVYVTKGQQVTADMLMAELEQSSMSQDVINAAIDLANAQKDLEDLLNSNTVRANAELALIQAEQALVSAQKTAQSKLYKRASQETIDIAKANLIQAQAALDRAAEVYNQNKSRSSDDVQYAAALSSFAQAQQKFDSAQLNYEYVQSLPDPLTVQEANAEQDLAQAKYLDAKRAWERVKDGPPAADVAAAEAKVAAVQAVLDQAKIISPIAGTVVSIDTNPGDLVSAQMTAIKITDLSRLYLDISVSEVDISQVQLGQPVEIVFDAISDKTYTGKVTDIAMEGTSSNGSVNFTVTAELIDRDEQIRPGMTASANIVVNQKDDILLVPSSAIRTINNQQIVYKMVNSVLTPVIVTTGDTDAEGTSSELLSGELQEGDLIVLNPPSETDAANAQSRGLFGGLLGGGVERRFEGGPAGGDFPPDGNSQGGNGGPVIITQ